jgi:prepilin peptidase CpaA
MTNLSILFLLAFLVTAAVSDLSSYRIPNWVSLGGMAVALLLATLDSGVAGLMGALGGVGIGFACFIVPYAFSIMAAGDVKLMMMVGAFVGSSHALEAVLATLLIGGLLALVLIAFHGGLRDWLRRCGLMLTALVARRPTYIGPARGEAAAKPFPYAVAIFLGAALTLLRAHVV